MMPRDKFSPLWMETRTRQSTNRVVFRRPIACSVLVHSTRKVPSLNFLMLLRVLVIALNLFWIAKGDSLLSGRLSLYSSMTRNLGQFAFVSVKHSISESVSICWLSLSLNLLFVLGYHVTFTNDSLCFVPTHQVHQDAHKRTAAWAQNVIYSGDKKA